MDINDLDAEASAMLISIFTLVLEQMSQGHIHHVVLPNDLRLCVLGSIMTELELENGQRVSIDIAEMIMERTHVLCDDLMQCRAATQH